MTFAPALPEFNAKPPWWHRILLLFVKEEQIVDFGITLTYKKSMGIYYLYDVGLQSANPCPAVSLTFNQLPVAE